MFEPFVKGWEVFPAYAGMFLVERLPHRRSRRFPRIRGDVPPIFSMGLVPSGFSPHTRGCSVVV